MGALNMIFNSLIINSANYSLACYSAPYIEYWAFSKYFDPIVYGEIPPLYECIVHSDKGVVTDVSFKRRDLERND